jgi:general secretion pathway protein F
MATTTFHFRAVASDGKMRSGSITAESHQLVARELRRQGLTPVYVGEQERKSAVADIKLPSFGGGAKKDVLYFTQELSTLLTSGIPVDRALAITAELTERKRFKVIIQDVLRVLKGGRSLADSLATHPVYFSDLYINMVRAGEASGSLAAVFERLSEFERSRDDLRNYIISAMVYPCLLALVGLGAIIVLLTFVVPRFASVFADGHMKVPVPTMIMLEASKVITTWWWAAAIAILGTIIAFRLHVRTESGRRWWDVTRLRIPVLGDALRKAETSRFARAMSTLVANTVPLVQSIHISAAILNNRWMAAGLKEVAQGVKRGEGIAGPLRRVGVFPPLAAHLLTVGEETGKLDAMFARMADIYETETRAGIKRFTALFEPLVILIMGILVGALILSMLLAITSINEVAI